MSNELKASYPPKGMERQEIEFYGPKGFHVASFLRWGAVGVGVTKEAVWLVSGTKRWHLETPPLRKSTPIPLEGFALSPHHTFLLGMRKICRGDNELFLWIRQKGDYKRLPLSVNDWILKNRRLPDGLCQLDFIRVLRWEAHGNKILLGCNFDYGRLYADSTWMSIEIDLVRGKFGPFRKLHEG